MAESKPTRAVRAWVDAARSPAAKIKRINELQRLLAELNPIQHPVANVQWVPSEEVSPNDYNPNSVAVREMSLLHLSIQKDGYTQPIVTAVEDDGQRTIVDGFHRYFVGTNEDDIRESTLGYLPVVEISTVLGDRMEATVRHNRARGRHSMQGMSSMVFQLLDEGYTEEEVMDRLGMEASEVARLTHITGFAKLMEGAVYSKAVVNRRQLLLAKEQGLPVL